MSKIATDDGEKVEVDTRAQQEVQVSVFLSRFLHPHCVDSVMFLLDNYMHNSAATNRHTIKFIYRLAVELESPELFYRVSVLRVIERILNDGRVQSKAKVKNSAFADMVKVLSSIIRRFQKAAEADSVVFIEALFPRTVHQWKIRQHNVSSKASLLLPPSFAFISFSLCAISSTHTFPLSFRPLFIL